MIKIRDYLCKNCGYCVKFCTKNILKIGEERNSHGHFFPYITDKSKCTSCSVCAIVCPESAIEIIDSKEVSD